MTASIVGSAALVPVADAGADEPRPAVAAAPASAAAAVCGPGDVTVRVDELVRAPSVVVDVVVDVIVDVGTFAAVLYDVR